MLVLVKVIFGKLSAAKKSADFRWPSRRSLSVLTLATLIESVADEAAPVAGSSWNEPSKLPKRPVTVLRPR